MQLLATGGKWGGVRNGRNKPKPLPPIATSCRSERGKGRSLPCYGGGHFSGSSMLTVSVQEYDIADVRPVFGKEAE